VLPGFGVSRCLLLLLPGCRWSSLGYYHLRFSPNVFLFIYNF